MPTLSSHLTSSHDLLWLWEEELTIPYEDRYGFWIRGLRFLVLQGILLCTVVFLFGTHSRYLSHMCDRRKECMNSCSGDFFPDLTCRSHGLSLAYAGNTYDNLYLYPHSGSEGHLECQRYAAENPSFDTSDFDSSRQERVHTCFPSCLTSESDKNYAQDGRSPCNYPDQSLDLLCVNPTDDCEEAYVMNEVGGDAFKFSVAYVFIGIAIGNVFQYIYYFLIYLTSGAKVVNKVSMAENSVKCALQVLVLAATLVIILLAAWQSAQVTIYGPALSFWLTFVIAFLIDQAKSLLFHMGVWYFLLRRCGYLKPNEEKYVEEQWKEQHIDKTWHNWREETTKLLETPVFQAISLILLLIYAVFVLFVLSFGDMLNESYVLGLIDQSFISVFLFEILLRVFSMSYMFFIDPFNVFDTTIVVLSFSLFFVGVSAGGLAVLRLMRLLRLLVVFRKVNASNKRKPRGKFVTALEEALFILRDLRSIKKLTAKQKKELSWSINIIESNKLYEVNLAQSQDKSSGTTAMDMDSRRWLLLATPASCDPLQWFDRDLDDYLYERQRDGEPGEVKEDFDRQIRAIVEVPERTHSQLEKIFDDIGKWRFNAFQYAEICGDQMIAHFLARIFQFYNIMGKFEVPELNLKHFAMEIYKGYASNNPFTNAIHAVDVAHRVNYFILTGGVMKHISDLDIMASMIASVIHDFQHPGVNNGFLVKTKNKKAIRYNDNSVLEHHHLAAAFGIMMDQNCDITMSLTEDQFWLLRVLVINMVMSTDLSKHERILGTFFTHMSRTSFPNDEKDKDIVLSMALLVGDVGNPLQPHDLFFKWLSLMMEEIYQQGDLEKHLGMEHSNIFYDRTVTNPYSCALGYIEVVVKPLANAWVTFLPDIKDDLITKGLKENTDLLLQKEAESIQKALEETPHDSSSAQEDTEKKPLKRKGQMTNQTPSLQGLVEEQA